MVNVLPAPVWPYARIVPAQISAQMNSEQAERAMQQRAPL